MPKKKISKEAQQKYKEFKKMRRVLNLPKAIQSLPLDIQRIIHFLVISKHNRLWFNEHKEKLNKNLENFKLDYNTYINRNRQNNGYWIGTPISNEDVVISKIPKYHNHNNLCNHTIDKCQQSILTTYFSDETKEKYNLKTSHEYKNSEGVFWFHPRCRCMDCDRIKIAAIQSQSEIKFTEKKEYGSLERKINRWDSVYTISGIGGYSYFETEDNKNKHKFHVQFKGIKLNKETTWTTHQTYLDHLKKIYRLE